MGPHVSRAERGGGQQLNARFTEYQQRKNGRPPILTNTEPSNGKRDANNTPTRETENAELSQRKISSLATFICNWESMRGKENEMNKWHGGNSPRHRARPTQAVREEMREKGAIDELKEALRQHIYGEIPNQTRERSKSLVGRWGRNETAAARLKLWYPIRGATIESYA